MFIEWNSCEFDDKNRKRVTSWPPSCNTSLSTNSCRWCSAKNWWPLTNWCWSVKDSGTATTTKSIHLCRPRSERRLSGSVTRCCRRPSNAGASITNTSPPNGSVKCYVSLTICTKEAIAISTSAVWWTKSLKPWTAPCRRKSLTTCSRIPTKIGVSIWPPSTCNEEEITAFHPTTHSESQSFIFLRSFLKLTSFIDWNRIKPISRYCGLKKAYHWHDLSDTFSNETLKHFSTVYESPEDIDLWTAGVSERPLPGSMVGPVFGCIIGQSFKNLRAGDRFWHENPNQPSSFTLGMLRYDMLF